MVNFDRKFFPWFVLFSFAGFEQTRGSGSVYTNAFVLAKLIKSTVMYDS